MTARATVLANERDAKAFLQVSGLKHDYNIAAGSLGDQAVAAGLIGAQHQSCCLECLLDHMDLALVQLEIMISQSSVSLPVSSFSTSRLNVP
jgi:hypothetical protein